MKNLLFLIVLMSLVSCGYSTPKVGDISEPFVVKEIYQMDETYVKYIGFIPSTVTLTLESGNCAIIAKKGLYNIGDTIELK